MQNATRRPLHRGLICVDAHLTRSRLGAPELWMRIWRGTSRGRFSHWSDEVLARDRRQITLIRYWYPVGTPCRRDLQWHDVDVRHDKAYRDLGYVPIGFPRSIRRSPTASHQSWTCCSSAFRLDQSRDSAPQAGHGRSCPAGRERAPVSAAGAHGAGFSRSVSRAPSPQPASSRRPRRHRPPRRTRP